LVSSPFAPARRSSRSFFDTEIFPMRKLTLFLTAGALALGGAACAQAQADTDGSHWGHGPMGDVTLAQAQAKADQMFAKLDANGDGQLDQADRAAAQAKHFAAIDTDGNGEVTQAEMQAAHERMAAKRQARQEARGDKREANRDAHFAALDTDKSGGLSQAELEAAHKGMRGAHPGDANAAGHEGHRGMHRGMHGHRGMGGMAMAHGMLKMADADGNGAVTKAEFDAAVAKHFAAADTDGNGTVTKAERQAAHAAMRTQWQQRRAAAAPQG